MLWLLAPVSRSVYRRIGRVAGHTGRYYARFTACCRGCSASPCQAGNRRVERSRYLGTCNSPAWNSELAESTALASYSHLPSLPPTENCMVRALAYGDQWWCGGMAPGRWLSYTICRAMMDSLHLSQQLAVHFTVCMTCCAELTGRQGLVQQVCAAERLTRFHLETHN